MVLGLLSWPAGREAERRSGDPGLRARSAGAPSGLLVGFRVLLVRIGPAQRRRQHDVDLAVDRIARAAAELECGEFPAEHGEAVDRLRALVTLDEDARREPVRSGPARAVGSEPHVFRAPRDLHRGARANARRQPGDEAMAGWRLDRAELAVAVEHAA